VPILALGDRRPPPDLQPPGTRARGAPVKSGYGLGELSYLAPGWARQPDLVADNLLEAVERILGRDGE
jgi:hypothetical protein